MALFSTKQLRRKFMKKLLAIFVAIAMIGTLTITASAASFKLDLDVADGTGWSEWAFGIVDDEDTGVDIAILQDATEIKFTFTEEPEGGVEIAFLGDGNSWSWKQVKIFDENADEGTSVTVKVSDLDDWAEAVSGEGAKFAIGHWSADLEDILASVEIVYGSGGDPTPPPAGENGENGGVDGDKKDVETGIGDVAVASAIALVAVGAVVFSRKRK
jgi:hypothetical protein